MSVTFGFYNALNHDRTYDAIQMSSIFDGIIRDGIFMSIGECMVVKANSGLTVNVMPGRAWFNHTWTLNDANHLVRWEANAGEAFPEDLDGNDVTPETVADRIDAVILRVNSESTVRANFIGIKKGTPSTVSPQKPTMVHTDTVNEYPLAYVTVKAGITEIKQDDIENMVGTSETPFITGILDTVNIDDLILQWKGQWTTWLTGKDTEFNAWFATKDTDYTTWITDQKADFDAWFANMKYVLDGDAAGKLQNEIDNLVNTISKMVHLRISYDTAIAGNTITVSNGTEVYNVVAAASGLSEVNCINLGTWTVSTTIDGKLVTITIPTTFYGNYDAEIVDDKFDYKKWLEKAGITGTFASLEAVLADEKTVRILMTKHDAVDYLVECVDNDSDSIETILKHVNAIKWINLRDYALDTLYENTACKTIMDAVDLYGYGEVGYVGKVPTMTSNTAPSGEASAGTEEGDTTRAWKAFDAVDSTSWQSSSRGSGTDWIQYKFLNPTLIKSVELVNYKNTSVVQTISKIVVSGSNNGTGFTDIYTDNNSYSTPSQKIRLDFDNSTKYQYYRLTITASMPSDYSYANCPVIQTLQFYAFEPLGNVPVMTSNSAPYGECGSSTGVLSSTYDYWKAFDGNDTITSSWVATNGVTTNAILWYKFVNPICSKRFRVIPSANNGKSRMKNYSIVASQDGTNWTVLYTGLHADTKDDIDIVTDNMSNDDYYGYYGIKVIDMYDTSSIGIVSLQFYGRELSVSVPTMTSNTAPYNEVTTNITNVYSDKFLPYKAFNSGESLPTQANCRIKYTFDEPKKSGVLRTYISRENGASTSTSVDVYINDIKVTTINYSSASLYDAHWFYIPYNGEVNSLELVSSNLSYFYIGAIQYYTVDYSEHDDRHYIYDHGVEVETLETSVPSTETMEKQSNKILISHSSTSGNNVYAYIPSINLADKNLIRLKFADVFYKSGSSNPQRAGYISVYAENTFSGAISLLNFVSCNIDYLDISTQNTSRCIAIGVGGNDTNAKLSFKALWLE